MKRTMLAVAVVLAAFSFGGCASEQYAQNHKTRIVKVDTLHAMTTQDVIALSKAGISDSLIVSMLDVSDSWFQLKPQEVIDLKNAGISEKVIAAMVATREGPAQTEGSQTGYYTSYWHGGFYPWGYWGYWPHRTVYVSVPRFGHRNYGHWGPRPGNPRRR